MHDRSWLPRCFRRQTTSAKTPKKNRRKKAHRWASLSPAITFTSGPLLLEGRRAMSIEPLEDRQLLSAVPPTLYVANSFYDQTTGTNTTTPKAGDTVNWLASGSFAEVDGLTFGTNAFTSVQSAVIAAASGGGIDVAAGTYTENVDITSPISLAGAGAQTVLQAPSTPGTGITIGAAVATTTIEGLTISGFQTGISVASGSIATLSGDTVTGGQLGAGIYNQGTVTLADSSVTDNIGGTGGDGGGVLNLGTMTVNASTISSNFAHFGGGIYNSGTLTVSDSTIAGDSATDSGGGIENAIGGRLTLQESTLSSNSVTLASGGGLDNRGTADVANTIIAGNSLVVAGATDPDVYGTFASTDHDLIGQVGDAVGFATTGATASVILGSDSSTAVGLGPLANNGGPTQTMAPLAGSPAIDNGNPSPPSPFSVAGTDQRGQPRTFNDSIDIGAYETTAATFYVANSFYDQTTGTTTSTPSAGDTVNWLASGPFSEVDGLVFGSNAFTSIQAAVSALGRSIDVAAGTYTENVDITRPLSVVGAGAQSVLQAPSTPGTGITISTTAGATSIEGLTISGFHTGVSVASGSTVTLTGDTVTSGQLGAGIYNSGTVTLTDSSLTGNQGGTGGDGGGILNLGTMAVIASTLSGNLAHFGGGIYNSGALTVSDSTFAGNSATESGGGIENASGGRLTLEESTLSSNSVTLASGGGLDNHGTADVANTIVAGNSATGANSTDPDVSGAFAATDHDLIGMVGDATGFTATSIVLNTDLATSIGLSGLANNGGPTQTMALLIGSPAIAAGDATPPSPFAVPSTDQRGQPRLTNDTLDIGAYQAQRAQQVYVATSFYDQSMGHVVTAPSLGDVVNWPASGQFAAANGIVFGVEAFTSLQQAVEAVAPGGTVDVAAGTYDQSVDIKQPLNLIGAQSPTADLAMIAGNTVGGGITVNAGNGAVHVQGFNVSGFATGVVVDTGSNVTLADDAISGNSNTGGLGGGIASAGTLTITASTIADNSAQEGAGIWNASTGTLTVTDSTITGNFGSAGFGGGTDGGGIASQGSLTVVSSTISGNTAALAGGIDAISGTADVANTIIAGNSATGADADVRGSFTATDHDLVGPLGDATGFATSGVTVSIVLGSDSASAVGLGPLADNGGPTQTMALLAGSPALGAGNATPGSPFSVPATDQRGLPRVTNGKLDVGAYQSQRTQEYVATSFYDQTTGQTTSSPSAGDIVNWPASASFAEVDGLVFGTNAFTSVQAAVNAAASGNVIDVAAGTYSESVVITVPVSLTGAGPQTVLQAPSTQFGSAGVAINTNAGTTSIQDLTITQFNTGVSVASTAVALLTGDTLIGRQAIGSGILNNGTLTLSDSSVTNFVVSQGGGGISNTGTATVIASTISDNSGAAGGIYNVGALTVDDATITGNQAINAGGGIFNLASARLILEGSTVSENTAPGISGGGVFNEGAAYVANTIIAGNSASSDPDVHGLFTLTDHDLIGVLGSATGFTTAGATASVVLGTDSASAIGLGPLANNGGPTQTMALLAGSPAIDGGDPTPPSPFSVPATDQLGRPRTFNGTVDVGAYETAPTTLYVATSFYDQTTGTTTSTPSPGDIVNWTASGSFAEVDGLVFGTNAFTSIQAAVSAQGRTIDVAAGTYSESVTITHPVSIVGSGAHTVLQAPATVGITINATAGITSIENFTISQFNTAIQVASTAVATLTGDAIVGRQAVGSGILNNGTLILRDSSVTNFVVSQGGGGISNTGTATVIASTIADNSGAAGGIYNTGKITVDDATITGNEAINAGGGIFNQASGTLILEDSTVSGNTAPGINGGGVFNAGGAAYVANTIIAGNSASSDPDVHGVFTLTDHDLIGVLGSATGFTTTGPTASIILGSDSTPAIGLAALADNGGPTQTMALLSTSRAIDAGDNTPPAPFSVPGVDQRGVTRITALDPYVDIGAYEVVPLAATGQTVAAVEGAAFGPVALATFTDIDPGATASEFAATIIWGDGQSSAGTVTGNVANGFTVLGSHTYTDEGSYVVAVAINNANAFTEVTSAAKVSDPAVNATAVAISAPQGAAATVAVATFTDPGGAESTSDYGANIVWGDGQTSAGTISEVNGLFTVTGTNTYAEPGSFTAHVTITHDAAPAVTVNDTVTVSPLPAATSFVVEKGLAERSYIRYLDVTFNMPVAGLTLDPAHVKLEHFALDGVTLLGDIDLTNKISLIDKVMEIDFGAGGIGGQENLPALLANWTRLTADDGYYKLVIDPDGTGLHDIDLDFYRLFGDVIGNPTGGAATTGTSINPNLTYGVPTVIGQVTTADVDSISAAVGQTGSLLNDDINGAGSVTPNDRLLAARSAGRQLAAGLHLDD